jgi:hypothetical protein
MSDDARLQALYRRLTARDAALPDADALQQSLTRAGWPDEEGQPLDRIAASARDADLLRVALALAPDAQALERELAAARAPRQQVPGRRWLALAAGVGALAVLVTAMHGGPAPQPVVEEALMSASFESAAGGMQAPVAEAPIFAADFDS